MSVCVRVCAGSAKQKLYSTANQHLLVIKLLLIILMITIIVDGVFFSMMHSHELFYHCYATKKQNYKKFEWEIHFVSVCIIIINIFFLGDCRSCSSCSNFQAATGGRSKPASHSLSLFFTHPSLLSVSISLFYLSVILGFIFFCFHSLQIGICQKIVAKKLVTFRFWSVLLSSCRFSCSLVINMYNLMFLFIFLIQKFK